MHRGGYILCAGLLLLSGCGPVEEASRDEQVPQTLPRTTEQPRPPLQLDTRTDTLDALRNTAGHDSSAAPDTAQISFTVQIGAFRDPANASQIVARARERYSLPVLNEYFAKQGLYQIRIGMFKTFEDARAFRERMHKEYPEEYTDCWVVTLKR